MWAVFRTHTFAYKISCVASSARGHACGALCLSDLRLRRHRYLCAGDGAAAPEFDDWEQTESWREIEGDFVSIGVLPRTVVGGARAPLAIGGAAARAATTGGAWLTWVFNGAGTTRSELEALQRAYSAAAVGHEAQCETTETVDSTPPRLWEQENVLAFSIQCTEVRELSHCPAGATA